jgi:hypothetical protein
MVEGQFLLLKLVLLAGVQRAAAFCRGLGCPQKTFGCFLLAACNSEQREKKYLGTPQAPAGRTLHPRF